MGVFLCDSGSKRWVSSCVDSGSKRWVSSVDSGSKR